MSASSQPAKVFIGLAEFVYAGGDSAWRSCTRQNDYRFRAGPLEGTEVYAGTPTMEITLPELTGALDQQDAVVSMPVIPGSFMDFASNGDPFSDIKVRLWDVFEDFNGGFEFYMRFRGSVRFATRNPKNKSGLVDFDIASLRAEYSEIRGGTRVDYSCQNTLGGRPCQVNLVPVIHTTATIDSASGSVITVSNFRQTYSEADGEYWKRGYVMLDGLSILITDWSQNNIDEIVLAVQPPPSWIGRMPVIVPGCDKLRTTCGVRWLQLERFTGIGLAMQAYNPTVFDPLDQG